MKKFKKSIALILAVTSILALTGCNQSSKGDSVVKSESTKVESSEKKSNHYPVTITTHNNKKEPVKLTFNEAPKKVVAVYQNSIETMLALGLGDKIVAAAGLDHEVKDEYKTEFSKMNYLKEFTPSKESIIVSKPDFILGWYSLFDEKKLGDINYWNDNSVNTYISLNSGISDKSTIENEINDILNLGKIFNVEEKAKKLVDDINKNIKIVENNSNKKEAPSTIIIEFTDEKITNYGKNKLAGDMVAKLNAKLVDPEGKSISKEDLIKLNPDTIFVSYMDRKDDKVAKQEVDKVLNNEALKSLNAVKNKRVYAIPLGEMYSSGIRTVDGIKTFAKGLYPNIKE